MPGPGSQAGALHAGSAGQRREGRLVGGQVRVAEEGEAYQREHPRVCREEARDRAEGDGSGLGDREAIGAGRDGRKRDRPEAVLDRDLEAPAVGAREQIRLPVPAVAVDRADGVDDEAGRQPPAARQLGVAGGAAAELAALGQDRGSAGAVDRAVDPAAAQQRRVGRIDDRVGRLRGDVAAHQLDGRPCEVPAPHARALAPPPARGNRRVAPSPAARYKRPTRRAAEVMGWRRWWKRSPGPWSSSATGVREREAVAAHLALQMGGCGRSSRLRQSQSGVAASLREMTRTLWDEALLLLERLVDLVWKTAPRLLTGPAGAASRAIR